MIKDIENRKAIELNAYEKIKKFFAPEIITFEDYLVYNLAFSEKRVNELYIETQMLRLALNQNEGGAK